MLKFKHIHIRSAQAMITVPEATKKIIMRSRYLSEAISKKIINNSSLARYIKPEIEEMLVKKVSDSAIIMALNRLSDDIRPKYSTKNIFKTSPEMLLRSNLIAIILPNLKNSTEKYGELLKLSHEENFLMFSYGLFQTTIIASNTLKSKIENLLKDKNSRKIANLSAITIRLPKEAIDTPGIFYFFLKSLAWEGINIIEVISANLELNLIFDTKEVNRAFSILQSLFTAEI